MNLQKCSDRSAMHDPHKWVRKDNTKAYCVGFPDQDSLFAARVFLGIEQVKENPTDRQLT